MVAGGVLLVASSAIHLHLFFNGYRQIPTIGQLFVFQAVVGTASGLLAVVARRLAPTLLAAAFAVATLGGFLLSVNVGLFGFKDSWSAPLAVPAFAIELASATLLLLAAALVTWPRRHGLRPR